MYGRRLFQHYLPQHNLLLKGIILAQSAKIILIYLANDGLDMPSIIYDSIRAIKHVFSGVLLGVNLMTTLS